jgi:peptidoglycan/xylan/chitin deacetylase (PgdA/CDA1 family)
MNDVLVLCYHAVSPRWKSELSVTPSRLEAQLQLLLGRGYRATTFHAAVSAPPASKTLAVTFDDGFHSVAEHGFDVLARLGIPATIFVVTDFVDTRRNMTWPGIEQWQGDDAADELLPVSWDDLRRLAAGGWEVGSHTCSHALLPRCDDYALARELRASRVRCEDELGRPCASLAYPYGAADRRVADAAAAAGYEAACTLPDRFDEPEPLLWPRVGVWHEDTDVRFRLKVSPRVRRVRVSPAWTPLRSARRVVARSQ